MSLIVSGLGWLILFFVNFKTQICKSLLQRHLLATLSLITKQKKKEKKKKKKIKTLLQVFTKNFSWIYFSSIIYRTLNEHAQVLIETWNWLSFRKN